MTYFTGIIVIQAVVLVKLGIVAPFYSQKHPGLHDNHIVTLNVGNCIHNFLKQSLSPTFQTITAHHFDQTHH
jgi:hypothetical protein